MPTAHADVWEEESASSEEEDVPHMASSDHLLTTAEAPAEQPKILPDDHASHIHPHSGSADGCVLSESPRDSPPASSASSDYGADEDSPEEEEEEEPKLKYHRPSGSALQTLFKTDAASTLLATEKLLIVGTHWGMVHVMDLAGHEVKQWRSHAASVTSLSIDGAGEYIASASDDGKVVVRALYADNTILLDYKRPVKTVQLDPAYAHSSTRRIASAGLAGTLIIHEKGWFGNQDRLVCQGNGGIYDMSWRGRLIAWADDLGVKVYDTVNDRQITFIDRPANSPRPDLYRPHLVWRSDSVLLIGWASSVKVAVVKQRPVSLPDQSPLYIEIVSMFTTDFIISGIAPFGEAILLLAIIINDPDDPEDSTAQRRINSLPELRIVDSATGEEEAGDALTVKGYEYYQPNDYALSMASHDHDLFFILSPKDMVVARPTELNDRLAWLMDRGKTSIALDVALAAERAATRKSLPSPLRPTFSVPTIGQAYMHELIARGELRQAAALCQAVLRDSISLWEQWVFIFAEANELKTIIPFVPTGEPKLSSTVYEMILAHFLNTSPKLFADTVKIWNRDLYDIRAVIVAVEAKAAAASPEDLPPLLEALAELHMANHHPEMALEYYLRLKRSDVIRIIEQYKLYPSLQHEAVLFMDYNAYWAGQELSKSPSDLSMEDLRHGKAVQMLIHAVDAIPIPGVVEQLRPRPELLHVYLDALYELDPQLGYEYHEDQVLLYAQYDPGRLAFFLSGSSDYDLQKALTTCEEYDLVQEQVYLLGRMGDNHKALMLIIERLDDVDKAIDFAKEQDDVDLWEDLLKYSMDKPAFIRGLLENAGTHVDPIELIRRIPEGLAIPDLKKALLKIYQDCALELSLKQGCDRILAEDVVTLTRNLDKAQRHGILCPSEDMTCLICHGPLFFDALSTAVIFLCRHSYHEGCLLAGETPSLEVTQLLSEDPRTVRRKVDQATLIQAQLGDRGCPVCRSGGVGAGSEDMEASKGGEEGRWAWKAPPADDLVPMIQLEL